MNQYIPRKKAFILLEDGTIFHGKSIGSDGTSFGELCFNTGMTGYQEIFTDPSYFGQILVMATSHICNYGVVEQEVESDTCKIRGLVVKKFAHSFSRYKESRSLQDFLVASLNELQNLNRILKPLYIHLNHKHPVAKELAWSFYFSLKLLHL